MNKIFEILRYYNYRSKYFVLALCLRIINVGMGLLFPLLTGLAIDIVFRRDLSSSPEWLVSIYERLPFSRIVIYLVLAMMLVALSEAVLRVYYNRFRNLFSQQGTLKMRRQLYSKLQSLPMSWFVQAESGDTIQRCTSDVDTIHRFVSNQFFEVVVLSFEIAVSLVIVFSYDILLAMTSLIFMPFVIWSCVRYGRTRVKTFRDWDEAEGRLSNIVQEFLTGIRVVTVLGQSEREHQKFSEMNREFREYGFVSFSKMANFWTLSDLITYTQQILIFWVGTVSVISGRLSLGVMLAFLVYGERNSFTMRNVARTIGDASKVVISYGRLQDIMQSKSEPDESHLSSIKLKGEIEFRGVSFCYPNSEHTVLKDIDLHIKSGETVGILGPTGSGKTTLLLLLQKLFYPSSGEIYFDGMPSSEIDRQCLREQIGFNLQEPYIFSRSIEDNIRITDPEASDSEVKKYAAMAKIAEDIEEFTAGYETMVGERGVTLSGGQKQRIAIARTLMRDCPINIFDDSLSALDTSTDKALRSELSRESEDKTTIIVSHRIATLLECDRVAVIKDGEITEFDSPATLLQSAGLFSKIYALQQRE